MIFAMKMQNSFPFAYVVSVHGPAAVATGRIAEVMPRTSMKAKPDAMIALVLFVFN